MISTIIFGGLSWVALLGMTAVLFHRARIKAEEPNSYSLMGIAHGILLLGSEKVVEHSKRGFFNFVRMVLITLLLGYRVLRGIVMKRFMSLINYIDGKSAIKKGEASSIYLKNISVHKEEAKKVRRGDSVE